MMEDSVRHVDREDLNDEETATIVWDAIHGKSAAVFNGESTPEFLVAARSGRISSLTDDPNDAELYEDVEDSDWSTIRVGRDD